MVGPLTQYLFYRNQHAYRSTRSTDIILQAPCEIQRALQFKQHALGVFFDVEGAVDRARTDPSIAASGLWSLVDTSGVWLWIVF